MRLTWLGAVAVTFGQQLPRARCRVFLRTSRVRHELRAGSSTTLILRPAFDLDLTGDEKATTLAVRLTLGGWI